LSHADTIELVNLQCKEQDNKLSREDPRTGVHLFK
jgi:hypothetical protein